MAMLKWGWPVMGNAANMAFKKEEYQRIFPQLEALKTPSGDDVFLLHELSKSPHAVAVLPHADSLVYTAPQPNVSALFQQRVRWASKAKKYQTKESILVALLVFLTNSWLLFLIVYPMITGHFTGSFFFLFLAKVTLDFFLLRGFSRFYREPFRMWAFLVLEGLNLLYIPFIGLIAPFATFQWKGRKY